MYYYAKTDCEMWKLPLGRICPCLYCYWHLSCCKNVDIVKHDGCKFLTFERIVLVIYLGLCMQVACDQDISIS